MRIIELIELLLFFEYWIIKLIILIKRLETEKMVLIEILMTFTVIDFDDKAIQFARPIIWNR